MIWFGERDARHVSITLCVIIVIILDNNWDLLHNINTSITSPINCTVCGAFFLFGKVISILPKLTVATVVEGTSR